jgi:hypothetical protein
MNYHGLLFIPLSNIFLVVLLSKDLDLHRLNDKVFLFDLGGIGLVTDVMYSISAQALHILELNFLRRLLFRGALCW